MSSKMQTILCSTLSLIFLSLAGFGFIYLLGAFVEGSFELSKDTRQGAAVLFGFSWLLFVPACLFCVGPYLSDAIDEALEDEGNYRA